MAVTSIAEESPSIRCAICARPARRGDRLCDQCKTAVKRARHVQSVNATLLPRAGTGAAASGHPGAGDRRTVPARRAARSALPAGWGAYATLVAFGVAVSITGHYATDQQEEATNRERSAQAARAASATQMRNEKAAPAQPPMSAAGAAEGFSGDEVIAQIEWAFPRSPQVPSAGTPPGRKSLPDVRSAGDRARRPIETLSPDPVPPPAPTLAEDTAAVSAATPVPEVQTTPNADRRQVMAAALSRCERENFLAGFVCKERAWLQFCDGQWGEVPQCPSGVRSNNVR